MPNQWEWLVSVLLSAVAIGGVVFGYLFGDAELLLVGLIGAFTAVGVGYSIRHTRDWR